MPTHDVVLLGSRPPLTRRHTEHAIVRFDAQHRLRRIAIELSVQGQQKIGCGRLAELTSCAASVDFPLHAHVRCGFELQVSPCGIARELTLERACDIARARVVALDEIAVVGIHDPYEVRKRGGGRRMQARSQVRGGRGELRHNIVDLAWHVIEQCRLDAK
jgi:hypothetical protein